MICQQCGKKFRPSGHGSQSKYCSPACKAKAYRSRKKAGVKGDKPHRKSKTVTVDVSKTVNATLDKREFDRMMDGSYEDQLRFARDVLRRALGSEATPAASLAPIARELLAVSKQLDDLDPSSSGFDLSEVLNESDEQFQPDGFK